MDIQKQCEMFDELHLEFDDGSGVMIHKDDDWNTQDGIILKLIVRGGWL